VRLVVLVGLAIDQIAQSGLSSLSVIYYSAHLFRVAALLVVHPHAIRQQSCARAPIKAKIHPQTARQPRGLGRKR
ncbi:MAG: hypothetical protein E6562_17300, partial [Pantoea sp.]|uniref:hypothetical protein n=1 Tax=Pantoea sp. TaxID=69393 RepID=UPI002909C8ED